MPRVLRCEHTKALIACGEEEPRNLRYYQDGDRSKSIQALLSGQERVVLWWGTGLGKSLEAKVIASEILNSKRNPFTHILIAAPQNTIVSQFEGRVTYKRLDLDREVLTTAEIRAVTSATTTESFNVLQRFLTAPSKSNILVVTHQLFTSPSVLPVLIEEFGRGSNKRLLLIPDEKHHAATKGTDLGDLETYLINQGSTVSLGLTATNFRADGIPLNTREITWGEYTSGTYRDGSQVSIKDTLVLEQPLTKMMLTGFAPSNLETELVQSDNVNLRDLTPNERNLGKAKVRIVGLAQEIVDIWIRHGCVPTLVRYSCCQPDSTNEELRVALQEAFRKVGVEVVDAIGGGGDKRLIKLIKEENTKGVTYLEIRQNPIIIAINRATEGMDSPCRCLGISVGIPQSEVLAMQLPGRLMRPRLTIELDENGMRDRSKTPKATISGYPEDWVDKSKQVFIVAPQEDSTPYLRGLLGTLATMSGLANISLIINAFKRHGILNKLSEERVADRILKNLVTNEEAERAELLVLQSLRWWNSVKTEDDTEISGKLWKLARVYEKLYYCPTFEESGKVYPEVGDQALTEAISRLLAKSNIDNSKVVDFYTRRAEAEDPNSPAMLEELEALCEEFRIETQSDSLHDFRAVDVVYWGSKFEDLASKSTSPKSFVDIDRYYDDFVRVNARCPDIRDKLTPDSTHTFDTCHSFLKRGSFGPPISGGLRQYAIEREYGESWRVVLDKWTDHDHELVAAGGAAFRESYGSKCPVYKYLRKLVGKKIPESLTLEEACALVSGETQSTESLGAAK
jgi:superfamily II DNA or RNA helicase